MSTSAILGDASDHMDKTVKALAMSSSTVRTAVRRGRCLRASRSTTTDADADHPDCGDQGAGTAVARHRTVDKTALKAIEHAIQAVRSRHHTGNDGRDHPLCPSRADRGAAQGARQEECKHFAEEARVASHIRRTLTRSFVRAEKDSEISEDELRRAEADIQKATDAQHQRRSTMP